MADYEIIKPKVDLRRKIKVLPSTSDFDPVANAEQAMKRLSVNFGVWMKDEIGKLHNAWKSVGPEPLAEEGLDAVFRSAHDIKGQAHTMGYPIAGIIAGSLCDIIECIPDRENLSKELLQKHVQAIVAVVNEEAKEEDNVIGKALAKELTQMAQEAIAKYGNPVE